MKAWWAAHRPTQRRWIQLYTALLYNANLKGFTQGQIYTGKLKNVCVPGFNCYSCPGAIGACPLGALQNAIASSHKRFPYYVLGLLAIFGMTFGRVICGFLCPAGWLQELIYKLPTPKLKKSRFTRALSYLKYVILALFVVYLPLVYAARRYPLPAFCKYICPVGTFEGALGLLSNPANAGLLGMLNILFTRKFVILIAICVGAVFIYRIFCRFLCPLGAIYGFFCRIALLGVTVDETRCTGCGACVHRCKMDVHRVGDHECIHCGECIAACPTKAIHWRQEARVGDKGKKLRIAAWCAAIALLLGVMIAVNRPDKKEVKAPAAAVEATAVPENTPVSAEQTQAPAEAEAPIEEAAPAPSEAPAEPERPVGKEVGMLAPDFTLTTYDGESFTLSEKRGKITIINFWATWCTPCVHELPFFDRVWTENGGEVEVIAIHSSTVTDDVEEYLSGYSYAMPFALDEDGSVIESFGGSTILPMTIIVDQNGVIVYNEINAVTYEFLVSQIASLQK